MIGLATHTAAISYDIWETLLKGNPAFTAVRLSHLDQRLGLGRDADSLLQAYRASNRQWNHHAEATGRDGGMLPRLASMYEELGISLYELPDAAMVETLQRELGELRSRDEYLPPLIEPDLLDTLAKLQDLGLRQVLLSNSGMDGDLVMLPALEKLGILRFMEHAFFSAAVGYAKPSPAFYRFIIDGLAVAPDRIVHIGDNRRADYDGAVSMGLQARVYTRTPTNVPRISAVRQLPSLVSR